MSLLKLPPKETIKKKASKAWTFSKNWIFPVLIFAFALYLSVHMQLDKDHGKNTLIELQALKQQIMDSAEAKDNRIRERDKIIERKLDTIGRWIDYSIHQENNYKKIINHELAKNKQERDLKITAIDTMPVMNNIELFERNFTDSSTGDGR